MLWHVFSVSCQVKALPHSSIERFTASLALHLPENTFPPIFVFDFKATSLTALTSITSPQLSEIHPAIDLKYFSGDK